MFDLITIGDATIDTFLILDDTSANTTISKNKKLLCFNYADKVSIEHTAQSVGGNAANVAVGVKKLGKKTSIVTELGDDINGHIIREELTKAHVDTSLTRHLKNIETRYAIILNHSSERTILSYHAKRNYSLPKLPHTKWIYYTSLGKSFETIQTKLLAHIKKNRDIKLAMNPGSYQINKARKKISAMFPYTDLLLVNKEEAIKLVGKKKTIKQLLKALYKKGIKEIVITDSRAGSYAYNGVEMYYMKIYPIKAKARTGAGDAYTSGYLAATLYGKSIAESMQWGSANASGVILEFGAQHGLLTKTKLQNIIKKYPRTKPKKI